MQSSPSLMFITVSLVPLVVILFVSSWNSLVAEARQPMWAASEDDPMKTEIWKMILKKKQEEVSAKNRPARMCRPREPCGYVKFDPSGRKMSQWIPSWCQCGKERECVPGNREARTLFRYVCEDNYL